MENENITNDDLKQYEALKPDLKKVGGLTISSKILLLIFAICFIFVPFFQTNVTDGQGVIVKKCFSLFDEIKNIVSYKINFNSVRSIAMIYQMYALLCFAIGIIKTIYEIIKDMTKIVDIDSYALETYDDIKRGDMDSKKKKNQFVNIWFMEALFMEIAYLIYSKVIGYQDSFNSISWTVVFCVIIIIPFIVIAIIRSTMLKKIKVSILKEKYKA